MSLGLRFVVWGRGLHTPLYFMPYIEVGRTPLDSRVGLGTGNGVQARAWDGRLNAPGNIWSRIAHTKIWLWCVSLWANRGSSSHKPTLLLLPFERLLENGIVRYPLVGPTPPPGGYLSNNPSSKDYSTMYCYLPFIDCCWIGIGCCCNVCFVCSNMYTSSFKLLWQMVHHTLNYVKTLLIAMGTTQELRSRWSRFALQNIPCKFLWAYTHHTLDCCRIWTTVKPWFVTLFFYDFIINIMLFMCKYTQRIYVQLTSAHAPKLSLRPLVLRAKPFVDGLSQIQAHAKCKPVELKQEQMFWITSNHPRCSIWFCKGCAFFCVLSSLGRWGCLPVLRSPPSPPTTLQTDGW